MKLYQLGRNAWYGLLRYKLRSLLSTLGIVFAVVAVVSMLSIAEGAKHETLEQIAQLGMNNIIIRRIPLTEAQKIAVRERLSRGLNQFDVMSLERGLSTVSYVAPLMEVHAAISASYKEDPLEILAVTGYYQNAKDLNLRQGRFIHEVDVEKKSLVCVLGAEAAKLLGNEGHLGGILRMEDRAYRIVGILMERQWMPGKIAALNIRNHNRAVFIPFGTEPSIIHSKFEEGDVTEISVQITKGSNMKATSAMVKRILARNHGGIEDFQVVIPKELLKQAQRTQHIFNIVLGCIAGISLLVGAIGIMNIMLVSVAERTREIGIRRSIGASQKHIILQFLSESILLTIVGGCLGIILGIGCAVIISTPLQDGKQC